MRVGSQYSACDLSGPFDLRGSLFGAKKLKCLRANISNVKACVLKHAIWPLLFPKGMCRLNQMTWQVFLVQEKTGLHQRLLTSLVFLLSWAYMQARKVWMWGVELEGQCAPLHRPVGLKWLASPSMTTKSRGPSTTTKRFAFYSLCVFVPKVMFKSHWQSRGRGKPALQAMSLARILRLGLQCLLECAFVESYRRSQRFHASRWQSKLIEPVYYWSTGAHLNLTLKEDHAPNEPTSLSLKHFQSQTDHAFFSFSQWLPYQSSILRKVFEQPHLTCSMVLRSFASLLREISSICLSKTILLMEHTPLKPPATPLWWVPHPSNGFSKICQCWSLSSAPDQLYPSCEVCKSNYWIIYLRDELSMHTWSWTFWGKCKTWWWNPNHQFRGKSKSFPACNYVCCKTQCMQELSHWSLVLLQLKEVYAEILRVLKPGAKFASYEWVSTKHYDPKNKQHVQIIDDINYGNGLPVSLISSSRLFVPNSSSFQLLLVACTKDHKLFKAQDLPKFCTSLVVEIVYPHLGW